MAYIYRYESEEIQLNECNKTGLRRGVNRVVNERVGETSKRRDVMGHVVRSSEAR